MKEHSDPDERTTISAEQRAALEEIANAVLRIAQRHGIQIVGAVAGQSVVGYGSPVVSFHLSRSAHDADILARALHPMVNNSLQAALAAQKQQTHSEPLN